MNQSMQEQQLVVFDWGLSSFFGWGVYGLNLMLSWSQRPDLGAVCAAPFDMASIVLDPLELKLIEPFLKASVPILRRRQSWAAPAMNLPTIVLHALGNDLETGSAGVPVFGDPTIGVIFSQDTCFTAVGHERAKQYPLIITGSRWNRDVLVAHGIHHVTTVIQGVDTAYFHPAPKRGIFRDKFVVFSGGKLERRKAQDLVVQAFSIFASRHPDAILLTAWGSPWPRFAATLAENQSIVPIRFVNDQTPDLLGWTQANGIPREQVFHLGATPQISMPQILREADVALFPNRAEGGTNLVAMECMACGVPTILSANTGHLDLIHDQNCFPLLQQNPISGAAHADWGESDVDEIVATLEFAYSNRQNAALRGARGAEFISRFTWSAQLEQFAEVLRPYMKTACASSKSTVSVP